ncbi:MAG: HAD-IIB family hydrolase, partial [Bacteroidales bacterium]|nr:HAD-IIB family hydrolase [Bacteroidales bacterium]
FTDITDQSADKGTGLEKMAEYLGLKIEETMSFGDGGNDIPIIKRAGIGVVMGNATDEVKQFADYVTTSVDEDGVFNALRHFNVI